jgi:hypothetical protein
VDDDPVPDAVQRDVRVDEVLSDEHVAVEEDRDVGVELLECRLSGGAAADTVCQRERRDVRLSCNRCRIVVGAAVQDEPSVVPAGCELGAQRGENRREVLGPVSHRDDDRRRKRFRPLRVRDAPRNALDGLVGGAVGRVPEHHPVADAQRVERPLAVRTVALDRARRRFAERLPPPSQTLLGTRPQVHA